jgi:serine/threonine protein kinase
MMFVMLTGYFPYRGSTDEELYKKINSADHPKQDIIALKLAHHLISKMFVIDPEERITADGVNMPLCRY